MTADEFIVSGDVTDGSYLSCPALLCSWEASGWGSLGHLLTLAEQHIAEAHS